MDSLSCIQLTRESTVKDVSDFLEDIGMECVQGPFQDNMIDGEDFFDLTQGDLVGIITSLKIRKKFIKVWSEVTGMTFDLNGNQVPNSPVAVNNSLITESSGTDTSMRTSPRKAALSTSTPRRTSPRKAAVSSTSPGKRARDTSPQSSSKKSRKENKYWLKDFSIPTRWEPEVEEALKRGHLSPEEKNALTRQLCTIITAHTDQVCQAERDQVAIRLVQTYSFLKGSFGSGHQYWSNKIKERLLNLRRKAARNLKKQFMEEGCKVPKGKPGRKRKIALDLEVPAIPDGESLETLKEQKENLKETCKDGDNDLQYRKQLMHNTFPLRRREVLVENARVWLLLKDYPPLGGQGNEIKAELGRILKMESPGKEMRERFQTLKPKIIDLIRKSKKKEVANINLQMEECDSSDENEMENCCIMAALPYMVGAGYKKGKSHHDDFWKIVKNETGDIVQETERSKEPRLISSGDLFDVQSLVLAAEGMVVCKFRNKGIVHAVATLLCAYYVFNVAYPVSQTKNFYLFLEYLFWGKQSGNMPVGVENLISSL